MDGIIERFHCQYRVTSDDATAKHLTRRLNDGVRPHLAAALVRCLDQALADDPSVYILRRVQTGLVLALTDGVEDDTLIGEWGERLAGSVMKSLAHDPGDGANLVRFEGQADYVASFVIDLLRGQAWDRWYYLAFKALSSRQRSDALLTVLLDNRDSLPEILARIEHRGALGLLLDALPPLARSDLWLHGLVGRPVASQIGLRPLFAAAINLLSRLDLPPIDSDRAEALLRTYRELATEVDGDWSSAATLALGVARAVAFLLESGAVDRSALAAVAGRIGIAVAAYEWLDRPRLAQLLNRMVDLPAEAPTARPTRRGATPRQKEMLADIARAAHRVASRLDRRAPDTPANALVLAAALFAENECWRNDAAAAHLIEILLDAWATLAAEPTQEAIFERLTGGEAGDFEQISALGAEAARTLVLLAQSTVGNSASQRVPAPRDKAKGVHPAISQVAAQATAKAKGDHPPAPPDAVLATSNANGDQTTTSPDTSLETPVAGIFLLLRAFSDINLATLFERSPYPPGEPTLAGAVGGTLALGLRLAGDCWPSDEGPLDRSLSLFAGLDVIPERSRLVASFAAASTEEHRHFQSRLLILTARQRLADESTVRLFSLPAGAGSYLVAQVGSGDLWPLGAVLAEGENPRPLISNWLDSWSKAFETTPAKVTSDTSLNDALPAAAERPDWPAWRLVEPMVACSEGVITSDPHTRARERLIAALASLRAGRLDNADEESDADLVVALTATVVLRAWSRWLGRFEDSSIPYLLTNFVRRPGHLIKNADGLQVNLAARPLDMVLEMAGYLGPIQPLFGHKITFKRRSP